MFCFEIITTQITVKYSDNYTNNNFYHCHVKVVKTIYYKYLGRKAEPKNSERDISILLNKLLFFLT